MITLQPFTLDIISTHKCFYLLQNISNVEQIQLVHNTPAGNIEVDVADAFILPSGKVLIAWKNPIQMTPMYNLIAIASNAVEIVNVSPLERVLDIYDKPVDTDYGVFYFANSETVLAPEIDWRCDNGKFGPTSFRKTSFVKQLPQIIVYEPVLSVNGIGHIIYLQMIEGETDNNLANGHLNEDVIPVTGRTFWEALKIVREWSIVHQEPFNNTDAISFKALQFMQELQFSDEEESAIDSQVSMQIAKYLMGDTNARQRPDGVLPMSADIKSIVLKRLASCSLSALEYIHSGIGDIEELLEAERNQLAIDRAMFNAYNQSLESPRQNSQFAYLQNLIFDKKEEILNRVSNNTL
jgi:hypothetical protein